MLKLCTNAKTILKLDYFNKTKVTNVTKISEVFETSVFFVTFNRLEKKSKFSYIVYTMNNILNNNSVVYITRDIERALGAPPNLNNYFIISNFTDFAKQIAGDKTNVLLIEDGQQLDTWQLMEHQETKKFLAKLTNPNILVFKSTNQIERICQKNNWKLLNPQTDLANKIEEKISQIDWLDDLTHLLPDHNIKNCNNIEWKGQPFILQFNRAHTGSGTIFIDSKQKLLNIKQKFPNRPARVTKYIEGPIFTSNNVVTDKTTLIGNISYQITGLEPFTNNKFATIGNDWGLPNKILNQKQKQQWADITKKIGDKLRKDGWKGLFGIDVALEESTGKLFLIEINSRQPASTSYESHLQLQATGYGKRVTVFEAHLATLLRINLENLELINIEDGSQIILRKTEQGRKTMKQITGLQNLRTMPYQNTKLGSELLRIQSDKSIMKNHNEFNALGTKIKNNLTLRPLNNSTLSVPAMKVVADYLRLPFSKNNVSTPYFNNKRNKVRGGLRVNIGKGTPMEIVNEAIITGLREKTDVNKLTDKELQRFLVEHNLGVDCSGFAYHILDAEMKARRKTELKKYLFFPQAKNLFRKILVKLRTAESTSVKVLTDTKNTHLVNLADIQPGDLVTILSSKKFSNPDHVLLIKSVDYKSKGNELENIHYIHSYRWNTDGLYKHGVREGSVNILDKNKTILEQKWLENNQIGEKNETKKLAQEAQSVEIHRLNWL